MKEIILHEWRKLKSLPFRSKEYKEQKRRFVEFLNEALGEGKIKMEELKELLGISRARIYQLGVKKHSSSFFRKKILDEIKKLRTLFLNTTSLRLDKETKKKLRKAYWEAIIRAKVLYGIRFTDIEKYLNLSRRSIINYVNKSYKDLYEKIKKEDKIKRAFELSTSV